jgi:Na+-translocating ferredoxin:NAD+ oxidoreductase RnfG subunit
MRGWHIMTMLRRQFLKGFVAAAAACAFPIQLAYAKTFFTIDQAKALLLPGKKLTKIPVTLTEEQEELIEELSDVRVRHQKLNVYKSEQNDWFIVDQVIGKHENIDIAVTLDDKGKVTGLEVLTYRETYGHQVMHPKWRAQFYGKDASEHLSVDEQIKNISGATLSCVHITNGVNRLTQTWAVALSKL